MSIRKRRSIESMNLSFIDAISCSFGAMILLLVISKLGEPQFLIEQKENLKAMQQQIVLQNKALKEQQQSLQQTVTNTQKKSKDLDNSIIRLRRQLSKKTEKLTSKHKQDQAMKILREEIIAVQKALGQTSAKKSSNTPIDSSVVAGLSVDSQYIIFIIDTSGSMQRIWKPVIKKIAEVLDSYPRVKGIQIINDQGIYMFSEYRRQWIPDSKARRNFIVKRLPNWKPFSESNPIKGIKTAMHDFRSYSNQTSIYVFGDEFTGSSFKQVVDDVRLLNSDPSGKRLFRIHTIGFFTGLSLLGYKGPPPSTNIRFAHLMRILAEENGGVFVGVAP